MNVAHQVTTWRQFFSRQVITEMLQYKRVARPITSPAACS
jgi:hypothetical protein